MPVTYRSHQRGDAARLAALTVAAMPGDAITTDWFTENVLLDVNFSDDGLIIAEQDGGPVGFIYATRNRGGSAVDTDGGWITIGCVHPAARNQGIGAELVERAAAHLARTGSAWVEFSGYPPAYFLPGLDTVAYPEAEALLTASGFTRRYTAAAMSMDLSGYLTPAAVLDLDRTRRDEGYQLGTAGADELPEVISFATANLAADWGGAVRDSVLRHGRIDRVLLARDPGGAVVGFATYGAYRGLVDRFGPFGVHEQARGTGLGKLLLHRSLTAMRAEGAQLAWFLWTGEQSPAGHLYRSAGFTVTRRFDVLRRTL